ncbi:hypothetical protein PJP14_29770, partial [Mycobacterium kansasii]
IKTVHLVPGIILGVEPKNEVYPTFWRAIADKIVVHAIESHTDVHYAPKHVGYWTLLKGLELLKEVNGLDLLDAAPTCEERQKI